jgi:hypothetical protein
MFPFYHRNFVIKDKNKKKPCAFLHALIILVRNYLMGDKNYLAHICNH